MTSSSDNEATPRVWHSFAEVPEGVVVQEINFLSYYKWVGKIRYMDYGVNHDGSIDWDGGEHFGGDDDWLDDWAPFTEVLGAK